MIIDGREAIPEPVIYTAWLAMPGPRPDYRCYLRQRSRDAPIGPIDIFSPPPGLRNMPVFIERNGHENK